MIISNSKKYIYIHIPKCGGTTISHILSQKLLPQDVSLAVNPHLGWDKFVQTFEQRFKLHKHSTAAQVAKAMGVEYFKSYFVFTCCRNPFARAYSAFTFTKRADARHRPESERYKEIKDMNFEEFLKSKYMQEKKIEQARPQIQWVRNAPSKVHVFKLENIIADLNSIMIRFYGEGVHSEKFTRENFSTGENDWIGMSQEAERIIKNLYKEDFVFFGYSNSVPR